MQSNTDTNIHIMPIKLYNMYCSASSASDSYESGYRSENSLSIKVFTLGVIVPVGQSEESGHLSQKY